MAAGRKTQLRVLQDFDVPSEFRGFTALRKVVKVSGQLNAAMTELARPFGLTVPHLEVLFCLKDGEGISQQDLSERLLVTKGNICVMVQKMETSGLLERRPNPVDQRFMRVYLTDAARQVLAKLLPAHRAMMKQVLDCMTVAEHKMLHTLLLRLSESFDAMSE